MGRSVNAVVSNSIAANSTLQSALSGNTFERAPFDCFLSLYETGSATGIQSNLTVQGDTVMDPQPVNAQNRIPVTPDDLTIAGVPVAAGSLIKIRVANTTAGALTHNARVVLEEAEVIYQG